MIIITKTKEEETMPVYTNLQAAEQLSEIQATDIFGLMGTAGAEVVSQKLIDAIADRVMTKLLTKSQVVNNLQTSEIGKVLDAAQGKVLKDQLDELSSNLRAINTSLDGFSCLRIAPIDNFSDFLRIPSINGKFALMWYSDRAGGTDGSLNGLIILDASQGKLSYNEVSGTYINQIVLEPEGEIFIGFSAKTYWQVNLLIASPLG